MKIAIDITADELQQLIKSKTGDVDAINAVVRAAVASAVRENLPTEAQFRETVEAMVTMAKAINPASKRKRK